MPDRAGVEVARAHHQAALGEQQRRAERELVGAEQRRDDDVAAGLEAAVDAHAHAAAQVVRTSACCVSASPSSHGAPACLIDEQRARAGAAVGAGDVDHVRVRLRDAGGDDARRPLSATSFTETAASGLTSRRSKMSCARSSIE